MIKQMCLCVVMALYLQVRLYFTLPHIYSEGFLNLVASLICNVEMEELILHPYAVHSKIQSEQRCIL